jgi:UDP-4-amino-4,6-dideoxy-N-acetyl-beta-L-altrosamine transaminase
MKDIHYGKQEITENDRLSVEYVLMSDIITSGPKVTAFEEKFAQFVGSKFAVAVSNGTAALHLSAIAMGVDENSRIITTPNTFVASANCVKFCGGNVDFVDIDENSYLIDIVKIRQLLESKPKGTYCGIIPVDFAGFPVNLEELKTLADEYNLWIIDDACHALGAYFIDSAGKKQFCGNGNFAELTCFSFHPVKHITTGEGGMITTNNEKLYHKLLSLRSHGIIRDPKQMTENHGKWYYEMQTLGFNYRLTDFQAALGISQLTNAAENIQKRIKIVQKYNTAFQKHQEWIPKVEENVFHSFHLYVIKVKNRLELYNYLQTQHVFCQIHYIPVHYQPYYKQFGWKKGDFPVVEEYYEQCISLPIYPTLTVEEQNYVIEKVLEFFK